MGGYSVPYMKTRFDLIVLLIVCVLAILVTRNLWLQPGQLGRNWDYSFTDNQYLQSKISRNLNSWSYYQLGNPNPLLLAQQPVNILYENIVRLVGHRFATFTLLYFVFVISYLSFTSLIKPFVNNKLLSILYAFSPFLFSDIIGGSWYSWVSYSISPLLIHFLGLYFFKPRKVVLYKVLFLSLIVVCFLQYFLVSFLFGLLYGIVLTKDIRHYIKTSLILFSSLCIAHFHWLIPNLLVSQSRYSRLLSQKVASTISFEGYLYAKQGLLQAFGLIGYLDRNFFYFSLPTILKPILLFLIVAIFIRLITLLKNNQTFSVIFLLFLVSNIFQKGGVWPFGVAFEKIMTKVPFMAIFRSPQRIMFISAILGPILLSFIWRSGGKFWKTVISAYVLVVLFGWLVRGDLGIRNLAYFNMSHPVMFEDGRVLSNFYTQSEQSRDLYRIAVLPASTSPIFTNQNGNETQGGIPDYLYLRNNTFTEEGSEQGKLLNSFFCDLSSYPSDQDIFDQNSVKYIVHRKDIKLIYSICNFLWDSKLVTEKLNNNQNLILLNSDNQVDIYQNLKYYPLVKLNESYLQPSGGIGGNIEITKSATVAGILSLNIPNDSQFVAREFKSKPSLVEFLSNFNFLSRVQSELNNTWSVSQESTFVKIEYLPQLIHNFLSILSLPILFVFLKLFDKNVFHPN